MQLHVSEVGSCALRHGVSWVRAVVKQRFLGSRLQCSSIEEHEETCQLRSYRSRAHKRCFLENTSCTPPPPPVCRHLILKLLLVSARIEFYDCNNGETVRFDLRTVSLNGDEVWIVGKPPLLLHSKDSGKSWKKVPVSKKLPGEPKVIVALGPGKAEMATSSGAIYVTENDGKNWKSQVSETIDATLNRVSQSGVSGGSYFTGSVKSIKRNSKGEYLAIAQRGNFYLSFVPGDTRWVPHNRISARRIQGMGFRETANGEQLDGAWMSLNGGVVTVCDKNTFTDLASDTKELFQLAKIRSGGIGIIDVGYRTPNECWATGGSGVQLDGFWGHGGFWVSRLGSAIMPGGPELKTFSPTFQIKSSKRHPELSSKPLNLFKPPRPRAL
ncbi:hcf136 [Symbiodinium sp. CCMP2456]|nr:hcf136 [Symbiodinium sp. CCMP2456]